MKKRVLILHTGGTLGMVGQPGPLSPGGDPLASLLEKVPELSDIADLKVEILAQIDSCDVRGRNWVEWAGRIRSNTWADGFVVIHGTDAMAYTASALSFLLEERKRPVVLTGSQRPLSAVRSDARQNLVDAVTLASAHLKEVMICFDSTGLRGNRSLKLSCSNMGAFHSPNCQPLAELGVDIQWGGHILKMPGKKRRLATGNRVRLSWVVPDLPISPPWTPNGLAVHVLATLGAGNLPLTGGWKERLQKESRAGVIHLVVSQCPHGHVKTGLYASSQILKEIGAVNGGDMTYVAAVAKARVGLGQGFTRETLSEYLARSVAGERSPNG